MWWVFNEKVLHLHSAAAGVTQPERAACTKVKRKREKWCVSGFSVHPLSLKLWSLKGSGNCPLHLLSYPVYHPSSSPQSLFLCPMEPEVYPQKHPLYLQLLLWVFLAFYLKPVFLLIIPLLWNCLKGDCFLSHSRLTSEPGGGVARDPLCFSLPHFLNFLSSDVLVCHTTSVTYSLVIT